MSVSCLKNVLFLWKCCLWGHWKVDLNNKTSQRTPYIQLSSAAVSLFWERDQGESYGWPLPSSRIVMRKAVCWQRSPAWLDLSTTPCSESLTGCQRRTNSLGQRCRWWTPARRFQKVLMDETLQECCWRLPVCPSFSLLLLNLLSWKKHNKRTLSLSSARYMIQPLTLNDN